MISFQKKYYDLKKKKGAISQTSGKEDLSNKYEDTANNFTWHMITGSFLNGILCCFEIKSSYHNIYFTFWINCYNIGSYHFNVDSIFPTKQYVSQGQQTYSVYYLQFKFLLQYLQYNKCSIKATIDDNKEVISNHISTTKPKATKRESYILLKMFYSIKYRKVWNLI